MWHEELPKPVRRMFFICHVYNAGLFGVEAWSPTAGVLQQLDNTWMSLACKSMAGAHLRAFVDDNEVTHEAAKRCKERDRVSYRAMDVK